jgi:hypothetical protein
MDIARTQMINFKVLFHGRLNKNSQLNHWMAGAHESHKADQIQLLS